MSQNEVVLREKAKDPQVLGVSPLAPEDITVLTMGLDIIVPGTDLIITVLRGIEVPDMVLNITALDMVLDIIVPNMVLDITVLDITAQDMVLGITAQDMVLGITAQDMVLDTIVQDMVLDIIVQDMVLNMVLDTIVQDTDHKAPGDRVQAPEDIL